MGGKRKITSLAKEFERGTLPRKEFEKMSDLFERDQIRMTWNQVKETAIACYETPRDAHDVLTRYSQLLRKAHQGTEPIINFIDAKLRKDPKSSRRKIILDNLEELCPWVDKKWSVVKKMKKHEREFVINLISERYRRYKKK